MELPFHKVLAGYTWEEPSVSLNELLVAFAAA